MTQRQGVQPVTCYPFNATRTQVWRKASSPNYMKDSHPSTVVKLPETAAAAKRDLASMSTQQALAARYLRNSMAISYAATGIAVFHLGGLPGSGKTTIVKELIAELSESKLVDTERGDILLCSKSNSAKATLTAACETNKDGALLYPARTFTTLNCGFSIPVVHNKNEVTRKRVGDSANWLKRKVMDCGLGNLQFLVIDEYTMTNCREVVYIDAILRMLKFRPDVPFGGVFVLLLGDNRQNSAVIEDNDNVAQLNGKQDIPNSEQQPVEKDGNEKDQQKEVKINNTEDGGEKGQDEQNNGFRKGGVEDGFCNDNSKLYTDLLIKILRSFASKDCFGNAKSMKMVINNRLEVLLRKLQSVSSTNNDIILAYDRSPHARENKTAEGPSDNDDFDSDDNAEFECDETQTNFLGREPATVNFQEFSMQNTLKTSNRSHEPFSTRCKDIAEANLAFKGRVLGNARARFELGTAGILKGAPLSAVVEEGLESEIQHLTSLKSMSSRDLETFARYTFNEIVETAMRAMVEIDNSGREKFYIVSSLSERFKDAHVTSLMDGEILNAKLLYGLDESCCDALPLETTLHRSMVISACIKNAFIRDGMDIKNQTPIAEYFKLHLKELGEFLSDGSLSYSRMVEKSLYITTQLMQRKNSVEGGRDKKFHHSQRHHPRASDDEDDYQFLDDGDFDTFGDQYFNSCEAEPMERVVSRPDVPDEVCADSTTNERVGALVDFHVPWYHWLFDKRPSDIVRSRFWHLYALVRMQQVKLLGGKFPSLDKGFPPVRLFFSVDDWNNVPGYREHDLHEEYWLRVLSMPISSGGDTQQSLLLPAYSSYLSAVSRTFIMSSLKRVNAVKHAYALMYGLSLLDMTVNVNELVDSRRVACLNSPIGYAREFAVGEYFGSIFPSIVDEYLMQRPGDVLSEARLMENVGGSLKVSHAAALASHLNRQAEVGCHSKRIENTFRYTTKSIILAMRMLTSISKGNERSKLTKSKMTIIDREEERATPANKRPKMANGVSTTTTSLADRFSAKVDKTKIGENCAVDRMMGAITLTRGHAQKNAVSNLVDRTIINQSGVINKMMSSGDNSIKVARSDTRFVIKNMDVSYMSSEKLISPDHRGRILEAIRHSGGKPFIDSITDSKLIRESQNRRTFTKILTDLKNKVTHVKSVNLYQGQNVVFTNTNVKQIHGAPERFVTKDTGVVTDIAVKNGQLTVSVLVERLGKNAIQLTEGRNFLGVENAKIGGPRNAYVQHIPIDSSQAMTIYSCQGQTFCRDTIVDLTNASNQDAYVAITRNSDPLNLYVVQSHETERKNLSNIKYSMGKDRSSLLPLGGVGNLGGDDFANYDAINVSKEMLQSVVCFGEEEKEERLFSALDPTSDTVTAAQRFIMNRSGNVLAFNSLWMVNTAKILREDGSLDAELRRIDEFFFGKGNAAKEYAKYYADMSHEKLMELFTAVTRSVTHYCMTGNHVTTPSLKMMHDHVEKHKNKKDYVKIHPSFLNPPPMKASLTALFYDVAPHTKAAAVLQFYAHYLFLVYEQLHICNSSFAFLPSPSPILNHHTRPRFCGRGGVEKTVEMPDSCIAYVPGGGLGYEPDDFASCVDGGSREDCLRIPVTTADHVSDNIDALRKIVVSSCGNYEKERADMCTEYVTKCMRHNLRRTGKFCRPKDVCGLSKHGAVVAATHSEKIEHSHIHQSDRGWVSLSSEANLYGLLSFMTRLAAASGVSVSKSIDEEQMEPKLGINGKVFAPMEECGVPAHYQLRLSEEILWCGQVHPMTRVQFTLHARANQSIKTNRVKAGNWPPADGCGKIFSHGFGREVLKGKILKGAQVIMITEMLGHTFAQHSTSEIRSTLFHGAGSVVAKRFIQAENTADVIRQVEHFVISMLQRPLSAKPQLSLPCARASFFISCSYVDPIRAH